jgi:hypothetical protein
VDTYRRSLQEITETIDVNTDTPFLNIQELPFSQNALAQYFEKKQIGENIFADIG